MLTRAALLTLLALPALAQPADAPPQNGGATNCTDVQVGSAQGYDCLNAQLGAIAHNTPRVDSGTSAPIGVTSPSNVVGTFNQAATQQRLGQNFGKSATPYRPPPVNYTNPVTRPHG